MSRTILLSLYLLLRFYSQANLVQLGPSFIVEPPSRVQYPVSTGTRLACVARGDPMPALSWLGEDGVTIADITGIRRIHVNGTLEMLPWTGTGYHNSGPTIFRCRATNIHGTILSREVTLDPVSDESWEAILTIPSTLENSIAVLTCSGSQQTSLIQPVVWYRGDRVINTGNPHPDARYIIAGNSLLIREARDTDIGTYSCLARHKVTGVTKRSKHAHLTIIANGLPGSAPRLVATSGELTIAAGSDVCVPCVAASQPAPQYTWYKEIKGRLQPIDFQSSRQAWIWNGGAALCASRATKDTAGAWLCKAYNVYGDSTAQLRIEVRDLLTVTVAPAVQVADTGSSVKFNCSISDATASLRWLHDGVPVGGMSQELQIHGVTRANRGMYQCIARRGTDVSQASAELRLGDTAPELHYTFIEQALRSGGSVSLRCAASGSPPPRFTWLLDGQSVEQYLSSQRYSVNEETSVNGDVVSILNISSATATDGGRYTCRAQNTLGFTAHAARLNIYGPPSIRVLNPVKVVAGANATVFCPYAGYPISSISWWVRGAERALSNSGRVSVRGSELRLAPALASDAGPYACSVSAPDGTAARRDIELQVRNPPKISPFMFSSELTEGSSVQVLCGVSSGDKPMYFSWLKNNEPIPSSLQIQEKSLDEFSLLMFSDLTAKHSGDYTCKVSNHAATVNYTATLSVKVAPSWVIEPYDAAVLLGASISLECSAKGYPFPLVGWFKKIGQSIISLDGTGEQWEEIQNLDWGTDSIRADNGTLASALATRSHQGTYRCKADNGVGPSLFKNINLTVHEPAHFDNLDTLNARNITCTRGQSASLTCHALGDSPLRVHWSHKGRKIDLNMYRATVSEIKTADGLRSVLQLLSTERKDVGEYRCHAENEYGRSEYLVFLHIEEPPEVPRSLKLGGLGSHWVRLTWRSTLIQGVKFFAIYNALHALAGVEPKQKTVNLSREINNVEEQLNADGSTSFVARLDDLQSATAYSLRIFASNHVGHSPQSDPLMFSTLEQEPTGAPQNIKIRPAGLGELHITWSAPPRETWNGELLGYVVTWRELGRFDDEELDPEDGRRAGTITSPGWSSSEITLIGLRKISRYAISLKAYNRAGAGPASPAVYATTVEGVPDVAPSDIRCDSLSSRSMRVRWNTISGTPSQSLRGYDVYYAQIRSSSAWSGTLSQETARTGMAEETTLQGLRQATNYSISVRARTEVGLGPPSTSVYCTTLDDVPGSPISVKALPFSKDGVVISWMPPTQQGGKLTHYNLYTRELGKPGAEWSQRVDIAAHDLYEEEMSQEIRGLKERTVYEFWVRASTVAGYGEPSKLVTASPSSIVSARIVSFGRIIRVAEGGRVKLRCTSVGLRPLSRTWKPLPRSHTLTDSGDLLIQRVDNSAAGNYSCTVRNNLGSDTVHYSVRVLQPPSSPFPRLARADTHALHLAWDAPEDGGTALLGYTIWWSRVETSEPKSTKVPVGVTAHTLEGLACGAQYRVTLRAHNAVGASPHSRPLVAKTRGDKAKAALGKEFIWANSTYFKFNLLAWRGRCPIISWTMTLRAVTGGTWRNIIANGESAEVNGLRSGTWYEVRVVARSAGDDTTVLYRAATHTQNGEPVGEPTEMHFESSSSIADGSSEGIDAGDWRNSLAPALLGGSLAAVLTILALVILLKRKREHCMRRSCSLQQVCQPHPQLYTTEPGKRNGKTLSPPDGDLHEISPYATFSMVGGGETVTESARCSSGCLLHLRTFGRPEPLGLAAPPSRPNLLRHSEGYTPNKRSGSRDSDTESSGSPCAECAAELYRVPAAHLSDTLPVVESSTEDTSYSTNAVQIPRGSRVSGRGRRRRDHTRHSFGPTARYFTNAGTLQARLDAL